MADKLRGGSTAGGSLILTTANAITGVIKDLGVGELTIGPDTTYPFTMKQSSHRTGLLDITNTSDDWSGIQIGRSGHEMWSVMANHDLFGIYNDTSNQWAVLIEDGGALEIQYNGSDRLTTTSSGINLNGTIGLNGNLNYRMLTNQQASNLDTCGDSSGFSVFYGTRAATGKPTGTDHAVLTQSYSSSWQTQLASDWRTNKWYVRSQDNGTWKSWAEVLTTLNGVESAGDTMTGHLTFGQGLGIRKDTSYYINFNTTDIHASSIGDIYIDADANDNEVGRKVRMRAGQNALQVNGGAGSQTDSITYNGNKVWHAGNDGPGSGLNADTVDGIHAASFVRSDADDTLTGSLLWSGDQDYNGLYWSAQFKDGAAHPGAWAYIRQATTAGNLEIGSDNEIKIYETDDRVLAIDISTNNKTLDAKGGLLENGVKLTDKYLGKTAKAADSQLLDGIDSTAFLRSNADDTVGGHLAMAVGKSINWKTNGSLTTPMIYGARGSTDLNTRAFANEGGLSYTTYDGSSANKPEGGVSNANAVLTFNRHSAAVYTSQMSFNSLGNVHYRSSSTGSWKKFCFYGENIGSGSTQYAAGSHNHDSVYVKSSEFSTAQTFAGIAGKYLNKVSTSGVLEVGRYIDFHTTDSTADYDIRLDCAGANIMSITGGDVRCSGNVTAFYTSDERLKSNITPIANPLEKLKALRTVEYVKHVKTTGERIKETGLIAQDVKDVFPEIVHENEDGDLTIQTGGHELISLAISAIKEQQKQIDQLKKPWWRKFTDILCR